MWVKIIHAIGYTLIFINAAGMIFDALSISVSFGGKAFNKRAALKKRLVEEIGGTIDGERIVTAIELVAGAVMLTI